MGINMKRKMRFVLPLTVLVLTSSCDRNAEITPAVPDGDGYINIGVRTRGGASTPRTYGVLLFEKFYEYRTMGYYYEGSTVTGMGGVTWLEPCDADPTGAYLGKNCAKGLRYDLVDAGNRSMYLCAVSPAVAPECYDSDAGVDGVLGYGFRQSRVRQSNEVQYISQPVSIQYGNVYANGQYVYDAADMQLTEYRSRISVRVRCGEDIDYVNIRGMELAGTMTVAYYNFFSGYEKATYGTESIWSPESPLNLVTGSGEPGQWQNVVDGAYILSQDYSATDEFGELKYRQPYLNVLLGTQEGDPVVSIPFTYNMQPQYDYQVSVTVNSVYVRVEVTAVPWDYSAPLSTVIGEDNPIRVYYDNSALAWQTNGGTGTSAVIDDITE